MIIMKKSTKAYQQMSQMQKLAEKDYNYNKYVKGFIAKDKNGIGEQIENLSRDRNCRKRTQCYITTKTSLSYRTLDL